MRAPHGIHIKRKIRSAAFQHGAINAEDVFPSAHKWAHLTFRISPSRSLLSFTAITGAFPSSISRLLQDDMKRLWGGLSRGMPPMATSGKSATSNAAPEALQKKHQKKENRIRKRKIFTVFSFSDAFFSLGLPILPSGGTRRRTHLCTKLYH